MKGPWLTDYLGRMQVAASDACSFVEGLDQADFLDDKRTQSAVVMSLIVIGEAATKAPRFNHKLHRLTLPCTNRTLRGAAIQIAMLDSKQHASASAKATR